MTDYGHDLSFGSFLTPGNADPQQTVALAQESERAGLDLVTFQDHPYQPGFLDTWTLLSYVAARTERVHLSANVLNLPLRQPAVLARSAASLDLLTGGRVELGLGAGAFWDAIEAMGAPRLTPGQAVDALSEAIDVIRGIWDADERAPLRAGGEHHRVRGAKRGPAPAHPIEIWLGAYKPRMLRLTGAKADGWLPSLGYMKSLSALTDGNTIIDEAAAAAGREPAAIRRLLNIGGQFGAAGSGMLSGPPEEWVDQLAVMTLEHGMSTYILSSDDPHDLAVFGQEVAPALRELVAAERATADDGATGRPSIRLTAPGRGGAMRRPSPAHPDAELSADVDYAGIPSRLQGKAFTPRDAGYDDVRSSYMRVGHPALVIMAEDADDVSAAVLFAREQDVPLSVRSGGHGIGGLSTNDGGIVIDVSRIDGYEVLDPAARRFRVGPGATWGHVAERLAERGWAMTSGNFGDTGVGGLATAGGLGYLARKHGMTVDHVTAAELVLADGSQVRADAATDPDLLWAVRGAGSHVGIVTALELEALPLPHGNVVFAQLVFDATDTAAVIERWADLLAASPRDLTSFLNVSAGRGAQPPVAHALLVWAGDDVDAATAALEPLLDIGPVLQQQAQLVPYAALIAPRDGRHVGQQRIKMRNGYLRRMTAEDAAAIAALLDHSVIGQVELRSVGGAIDDVAPEATAFAHRDAEVLVAAWGMPDREDDFRAAWATVEPRLHGVYAAYSSDGRPEVAASAYPGAALDRILEIKRRVDPQGVFRGLVALPDGDAVSA